MNNLLNVYKNCDLCRRNCHINRYQEKGVCGASNELCLARAALHFWEEPCISGEEGSGAIFFSNCSLKCIFCQNHNISTEGYGKEVTIERFSDICLELQKQKANNINLVTPTHYVPSIVKGIELARKKGLNIPIVYNTSSYENIKTIKSLDGIVDVYLPDLKYYDNSLGVKYSHVENYFEIATENIKAMYSQVGKPVFDNRGMMIKGVIVRILVMPGHIDDAKKILKYLYEEYDNNIYISIMNQYTPLFKFKKYDNLNRKLTEEEYDEVVNYACDLGIEKAFIQEGNTQSDSFIPDFNIEGV